MRRAAIGPRAPSPEGAPSVDGLRHGTATASARASPRPQSPVCRRAGQRQRNPRLGSSDSWPHHLAIAMSCMFFPSDRRAPPRRVIASRPCDNVHAKVYFASRAAGRAMTYEVLVIIVAINAILTLSLWRKVASKSNRGRPNLNKKAATALWRSAPIITYAFELSYVRKALGADGSMSE